MKRLSSRMHALDDKAQGWSGPQKEIFIYNLKQKKSVEIDLQINNG